jgi:hypothetical protein
MVRGAAWLLGCLVVGLSACDMRTTGSRHVMADEGLSVEFPAGLRVCRTMSMGYAFNGFRADLDAEPAPCDALDQAPVARISIWVEPVIGRPGPDAARSQIDRLCKAYPPAVDLEPQLAGLALTDRPSVACVVQYSTERPATVRLQFHVMTEGDRPDGQGSYLYVWGLTTTPDRASSDLAALRALMAGTRLDFAPPARRPS